MVSEFLPEDAVLGIVVSVFNDSEYLKLLFDSLLLQSDSRFEVLIIDDSLKNVISKEFVTNNYDKRFTLRTNEANIGPFRSWNVGLTEMLAPRKYKVLSVIHEDDILDRDYVKNSIEAVERYPNIDIFHSRAIIIGSRGNWKFSFQDSFKLLASSFAERPVISFGDKGLSRILRNNFVFCPTMVFNVEMFREIAFETRWKMVGDLDFIARALIDGRTLLQLPNRNYLYRRHYNNLTAKLTRSTKRFQEEVQLYKELEVLCQKHGFLKSAKVAKSARILRLHVCYRISIALTRFDLTSVRQLISVLGSVGK